MRKGGREGRTDRKREVEREGCSKRWWTRSLSVTTAHEKVDKNSKKKRINIKDRLIPDVQGKL